MKADNDNEELSFITLGAATLNVVRYLERTELQTGEHDRGNDQPRYEDDGSEQRDRAGLVNKIAIV